MKLFNKEAKFDYIVFFDRFSKYTVDAAKYLDQVLSHFDQVSLEEQVRTMHDIEKSADLEKKQMLVKLIDEFLPPIDKEDIIDLSHKIDDVTDAIEEVLVSYYTYHITQVTKEALIFTRMIRDASIEMNKCLVAMQKYKKNNDVFEHIGKVNRIKSEGEKLYKVTVAELYQAEADPQTAYEYTEIYKAMRNCYLYCKRVTNGVEKVVMKNL
ncbi:DUF47 family protein [Alkalibacter rhizosphaerae]|uniref:DUF47 family protein n=1 Tax=Alkalibacter rhizosphaerae TaxID=2815577 RepID=A0A975AHG3_9FIRM|nr:DUF47 family protein [Alkalibacter rhizosphaerae]QSX08422.1 DUF47 family protein [Alkalibacter rhizosphaerae]